MENKELKKKKLEELKSTLESAKRLEETVEKIKSGEIQTKQKITEDDFKVSVNGTHVEPQVTTEFYDGSEFNLKSK